MKLIRSSETSVNIRTTWRYIPEDGNIHNYCCKKVKSSKPFVYSVDNHNRGEDFSSLFVSFIPHLNLHFCLHIMLRFVFFLDTVMMMMMMMIITFTYSCSHFIGQLQLKMELSSMYRLSQKPLSQMKSVRRKECYTNYVNFLERT
jgi:hypothetical protein